MTARVSVLALAALLLGGCSSPVASTSTTVDPLAVFPNEATYVWDEEGSTVPIDARFETLRPAELLREEADIAFAERGYRAVEAGPADYQLRYDIQLNTRIQADHSRSLVVLWLTLHEEASDRNVWAGAAQTKLHMGLTEGERRARLHEALEEMLEEFPPEQRE